MGNVQVCCVGEGAFEGGGWGLQHGAAYGDAVPRTNLLVIAEVKSSVVKPSTSAACAITCSPWPSQYSCLVQRPAITMSNSKKHYLGILHCCLIVAFKLYIAKQQNARHNLQQRLLLCC